jgi:hypothetical protein
MASAVTSVSGDASQIAHIVAYGATVTLALVSTTDVIDCGFSFLSNSSGSASFPTITNTGFGTAQFTMSADPGGGLGFGYLMQTIVNSGLPTQSIATYLVGNAGSHAAVPLCPGESVERHATLGWLYAIKQTVTGL